MEKHEKINVGIGALGVILSIIAIIVSYKSCTSNEEIAEKSGVFDKPDIYLGFGNFDIPNHRSYDTIRLIYGGMFPDNAFNLASFPFQINNTGKKNAEDIKLLIEYPKVSKIAILDSSLLKGSMPTITNYKREAMSQNEVDIVNYQISQLNPGLRITIDEPFSLRKTEIITNVDLRDNGKQSVLVKYSFIFSVTLMGKDLPTQKTIFSIACFNTPSLDSLINNHVSSLKRREDKKDFTFFVMPEKNTISTKGKYSINEYNVCKNCLYLAYIDDTSPDRDIILGLYNQNNKLEKIKGYNKENKIITDMHPDY